MRPRQYFASLVISVVGALGCAANGSTVSPGPEDGAGGASAGAGGDGGASGGGGAVDGAGGFSCTENPCKLVEPQCGCAPDDQCSVAAPTPDNASGRFCEPAGDVAVGQVCSASDKCGPGALCVTTSVSACLEYCEDDSTCEAPGGACIITLDDGNEGTIPGAALCTTSCDPISGAGCEVPGSACRIGQATEKVFTLCSAAGTGVQANPCSVDEDCGPTYGCVGTGVTTVCRQYCNTLAPTCPMGTMCVAFNPPVTLGMTEYGVCQ